jgi:hypothetical protein
LVAIPLLLLTVVRFGFFMTTAQADAGYFTAPIMNFLRSVLHASWMIDYNLHCRGKHFFGDSVLSPAMVLSPAAVGGY